MPTIPDTAEIVAIVLAMLAAGGLAAAWGVARFQAEGSRFAAAVAVLGLLVAAYGPLSAIFGWFPLEWLRG